MTQEFMIVSEEQAAALEKAGVKVEVQYVVKICDLRPAAPAPAPTPRPAVIHPQREVKYGHNAKLRWTDLKWTGKVGSQTHQCWKILQQHFHSRDATSRVMKRSEINDLLAKELMASYHQPFNSSFVSYLCEQKYLEPMS